MDNRNIELLNTGLSASEITLAGDNAYVIDCGAGKKRAVIHCGAINYVDDNDGVRKVIDPRIVEKSGIQCVESGAYKAYFPIKPNDWMFLNKQNKTFRWRFTGFAFYNLRTGETQKIKVGDVDHAPAISESLCTFDIAGYDGIKLEFQYRNNGIKELITISKDFALSLMNPYDPAESILIPLYEMFGDAGDFIIRNGTHKIGDRDYPNVKFGVPASRLIGLKSDIVIDPSVDINSSYASMIQYYISDNYTTTREQTSGEVYSDDAQIGQFYPYNTDKYMIFRFFMSFSLSGITAGSTINSATLDLYGNVDGSTTDFDYELCKSNHANSPEAGDFDNFDGWQSGLTQYTPTVYSNALNSSAYTAGYGNVFTINSAGKTQIASLAGGSTLFKVVVLSLEDINASAPTDSEYLHFGTTGANIPKLTVDYTAPVSGWTGGKCIGVAPASIGKINGVATASIGKVLGVD